MCARSHTVDYSGGQFYMMYEMYVQEAWHRLIAYLLCKSFIFSSFGIRKTEAEEILKAIFRLEGACKIFYRLVFYNFPFSCSFVML